MKRTISHLLVVGGVLAAYFAGAFAPLERGLADWRYRILHTEMTGDIVMVGIDSQSLRQLNVWPWPREYHARLIDRLMAAGARRVALDIDFSSNSSDESDGVFEAALRRANGRVILATFKQLEKDEQGDDSYAYTLPIPRLAREGRLGHVNVQVAADSLVRKYTTADRVGEISIPGMATLMAGAEALDRRNFAIDYSIRPETLPYIPYIEALNGNFDPAIVRGRTVIVGAAALELGDRIPVPVHQVLPGPVVQALIAETILQDRGLQPVDSRLIALISLLLGMSMAYLIARWSWKIGAVAVVLVGGAAFCISLFVQARFPLILEISPIFIAPLVLYLFNLTRSIDSLAGAFQRERFESMYRRAMMDAVVHSSFDGIMIADRDGNIELCNPSAIRLTGLSEDALQGVPIHSVLPSSVEIESLYGDRDRKTNVAGPLELKLARRGEELTIEMIVTSARLSLNASGGSEGAVDNIVYIYTFRNVSDRKRTEKVQNKAIEVATAANRAKTEFLANMSHELRTPLNAIIGFSDVMKNEMMGPIGVDRYREYITDINGSGLHLLSVVNDILDMSKIESGEMKLVEDELFIPDIINSSLRLVEERAKGANLATQVELPDNLPKLTGDARIIKQMLLNLLTNAIKFTPDGGIVSVGGHVDNTGDMLIRVRDTGIGIAQEDFDRILEPFGQADASLEREYEGTGLGLPLVKAMIELHQGELEMQSEVGVGTMVGLRFPQCRTVPHRSAAADADTARNGKASAA